MCTNVYVHVNLIFVRNLPHRDRKQKNMNKVSKNQRKKHGGDGKRRPLIPSPLPASWPCHPPAILVTPLCSVPARPPISWPKSTSYFWIPANVNCASFPSPGKKNDKNRISKIYIMLSLYTFMTCRILFFQKQRCDLSQQHMYDKQLMKYCSIRNTQVHSGQSSVHMFHW